MFLTHASVLSAFSVLGIPGYHLSREPSALAAPARQGSMLSRNIFDFSLSAIKFYAPIQVVKKFFMASCTLRIMQPPPTTASFSPDRHLNELLSNNLYPTSITATVHKIALREKGHPCPYVSSQPQ